MRPSCQPFSVSVINLDRDTERWSWMRDQLSASDVAFERLPAVLGREITGADRTYHQEPRRAHLSPAEIGCVLSHILAWRRVADGDAPFGVILEDDLHIASDFGAFLKQVVAQLPEDALAVHRFETFGMRVTMDRDPALTVGARRCFRLHSNNAGAGAYMMTRAAARHALGFVDALRHLPDTELFDPDRRVVTGLEVYQWTPAPCVQDMILNGSKRFASNLADDRSDVRQGLLDPDRSFVDDVRDVLRPAYTAAYSIALAPGGRQRADIAFG